MIDGGTNLHGSVSSQLAGHVAEWWLVLSADGKRKTLLSDINFSSYTT